MIARIAVMALDRGSAPPDGIIIGDWYEMIRRRILCRCFLAMAYLLVLVTFVMASGPAHAQDPDVDECATADLLRELGNTAEAKAMYVEKLKADRESECARQGLEALAPTPTPTPTPDIDLLAKSLTVVGTRWCPWSWSCTVHFTENEGLAVPLIFDEGADLNENVASRKPLGLLVNEKSGHKLHVQVKTINMGNGLATVELEAPDIEKGNGTYSGSFDVLQDDKKGDFTLTLKVRDHWVLLLLTVLAGVYVSNVVRIRYNKYYPVRDFDRQRFKLAGDIDKTGVTNTSQTGESVMPVLPTDESAWADFLRPYDIETPDETTIEGWVRTLRRYSIRVGSSNRLTALGREAKTLYHDVKVEVIAGDSDQKEVKALYEGLQAERTLLSALHTMAQEALRPAHFAFVVADAERVKAKLEKADLKLLVVAEEKLYAVSGPDPQEIANVDALSKLRLEIETLAKSLGAMQRVLHRWGLANGLLAALKSLVPSFEDPDKNLYYKAYGQVNEVRDVLKIVTGATELQDTLLMLDSALAILHGLKYRYYPDVVSLDAWKTFEAFTEALAEVQPPPRLRKEPGVEPERPDRFLVPTRQALYRFRRGPFVISLVIALFAAFVTLYVDKTFGSWIDYGGALAWGLGVDTASRGVPAVMKALGLSK